MRAGTLLSHEAVRPWLRRLAGFRIELRPDDGEFDHIYPEGVDILTLDAVFDPKDIDLLEQHYALFAEVMQALCLVSSAYTRD